MSVFSFVRKCPCLLNWVEHFASSAVLDGSCYHPVPLMNLGTVRFGGLGHSRSRISCSAFFFFNMGAGDPNSDLHGCAVCTLPTQPSPQLVFLLNFKRSLYDG